MPNLTEMKTKRGISIIYYYLFCSFISSIVAVQSFRVLSLETTTLKLLLSVISGGLSGWLCLLPLGLKTKSLLSAMRDFIHKKQAFCQKAKFPLEIAELCAELKNLCDQTQISSMELSRQDNARRELLANAAHDIKGPLSSISGYLEDCLSRIESENLETAKHSLGVCIKNTKHLERIVLEIFEAAKFDNLSGNLVFEVTSLDDFLNDIVQKFQGRAKQESKHLLFKPGAEKSLVQVDLGLFERALSNLIDNALKYSEADGYISIGSKLEAGTALIYVSDSGKGIPEKDLPLVFDRLYRVERDRSKEAKGSGFGLSIVKKIIEAHAGQIVCSSTQGAGSVFQIIMPILDKGRISEAMAEMISKHPA